LKDRATSIWTDYQFMILGHPKNPPTDPSLLCGYCNNLITCPRFAAKEVPDLEDRVTQLRSLLEQGKVLDKQIEPMKANLLSIVNHAGHSIKVNNTILSKAVRSRQHTDTGRLTAFLAEMGHTMQEFQESSSYSFLDIKTAKTTISKHQKAA